MNAVERAIREQQVIAVLRARHYRNIEALSKLAVGAKLSVLEVTLTGENALSAIEEAASVDGAIVGAGTVLTAADAHSARDAGARFLVSPACLPDVAQATDLPTMLAGMTPTELIRAHKLGAWLVKLFPAATLGSDYVRAIRGPMPDIRIVPSGGINPANARSFIEAGSVAVSTGWIAPPSSLETGDYAGVEERIRKIRSAVSGSHL